MKRLYLVSGLSFLLLSPFLAQQPAPRPNAGPSDKDAPEAADNTARNAHGQGSSPAVADQQPNNQNDLTALQKIRQAVVGDEALSFNAKNAKILVKDGTVTLRGPVDSAQEKSALEQKAAQVVGQDKVKNELEVKAQKQ